MIEIQSVKTKASSLRQRLRFQRRNKSFSTNQTKTDPPLLTSHATTVTKARDQDEAMAGSTTGTTGTTLTTTKITAKATTLNVRTATATTLSTRMATTQATTKSRNT